MHIVVCIKQTPAATNIPIDAVTGRLKTESLQYAINPFDEYAVEEALRIKERLAGATISVLSVGPARAEESIRSAIALGCDEGVLLTDPSFEGSDPTATAYLLSLGVRKLAETKGPVHLALCGKQTNDVGAGQVGSSLGAWLDWPAVAFVKKIPQMDDSKVVVERTMEDGIDTLEIPLPAVVAVIKEINEPRLSSLKGKMAAKKAVIVRWGAAELSPDAAWVGASSPTMEIKTTPPPSRSAGMKVAGGSPEEKAAALIRKFKEMKVI